MHTQRPSPPRSALRLRTLSALAICLVSVCPAAGDPSSCPACSPMAAATSGDAGGMWGTLLDTSDFPPRWQCGTWSAALGWTHIVADMAIWAAYTSIPLVLLYFVRKRRDAPFPRVYWLFALFVLACGIGHLIDAGMFWWPAYRVFALSKVITATISWVTVFALLPILPRAIALPSAAAMRHEIGERSKSEARFRDLLEHAPDATVIVSDTGRIVLINAQAVRMFGYSKEDLLGRSIETLLPERFRERHVEHRRSFLAQPHFRPMGAGLELFGLHKDGQEFPVEISLSPLHTDQGMVITAAIRDVTERKRMEQIRAANEELARSNAELEQFACIASHDLQEPLRMVSSFCQLLQRRYAGQLGPEADEYIGYAVDGAARMRQLVQDLLTYARVGRPELELRPVDAGAVCDRVIGMFAELIKQSQAQVTRSDLPTVLADETQLTQLFQNLIGNALKYRGDQPPEVRIEARPSGPDCRFSVLDNGIGIDPKYCGQVFEVFRRLHSRGEYPGAGIGLAVCKRIVDRFGGRIWVESQPGKGSEFYFTIPAPTESSHAKPDRAADRDPVGRE